MIWDPTARPADQSRVLKSSGGQASVVLRKWTAREHMAYEDRMTSFLQGKDKDEPDLLLGTMRLTAACLTVQRVEGFPPGFVVTYEQTVKGKRRQVTQPFDPTVPDHLLCLAPDVYSEIVSLALEVQPLPGDEAPADDGKGGTDLADEDDDADGEGEQGEDPSRTPPTHPVTLASLAAPLSAQ